MQNTGRKIEITLQRLGSAKPPSEMQARLVCSCRSRLYRASSTRRQTAVRLAAAATLASLALGLVAWSAHGKHFQLTSALYGDA